MDMPTSPARRIDGTTLAWKAFNAAQFAFTLAWTAAWISLALLVYAVTGSRRPPLRMASTCWAPGLLWGAGTRLQVEGRERIDWSRNYVFVANHQSTIDICALFRAVPVPLHFLLKQEMTRVPFVGWYARAMGMVFIERGNRRAATAFLRQSAELVRSGASLCIFPEGTRSRSGAVAEFKSGAFQAAIDAGADVVPVALEGSGAVLHPDGFFCVRPGTIRIRFGTALPTRTTTGAAVDRQALAAQAQAAVLDMLAAGRRGAH
jgi:1-acyl-sn-glycerol-3-phosphate acyltransferase